MSEIAFLSNYENALQKKNELLQMPIIAVKTDKPKLLLIFYRMSIQMSTKK